MDSYELSGSQMGSGLWCSGASDQNKQGSRASEKLIKGSPLRCAVMMLLYEVRRLSVLKYTRTSSTISCPHSTYHIFVLWRYYCCGVTFCLNFRLLCCIVFQNSQSKLFIPAAPRPSPDGAREYEDTDPRGIGDDTVSTLLCSTHFFQVQSANRGYKH